MTFSLQGLRILLPRPIAQAKIWDDAIRKHSGNCIIFPTIVIEPTSQANIQTIFSELTSYDILIFTSANAVLPFSKLLTHNSIPSHWQLASIGATTAHTMQTVGLPVTIISPPPYNSENLLTILQSTLSEKKRIAIIKGSGGRDLLQKALSQQGHQANEFSVYSRLLTKQNSNLLIKAWEQACIDYIIATSEETLHNLAKIITPNHQKLLLNTNLVLTSPRLLELANNLGFTKQVLIADNTHIMAVLKLLGKGK